MHTLSTTFDSTSAGMVCALFDPREFCENSKTRNLNGNLLTMLPMGIFEDFKSTLLEL